jgi:membrane protease YdiL (CAAX protease family)
MILKYNCPSCGFEIITRYLMPGDNLNCPECNAEIMVPEDAIQTDQEPNIFSRKEHPHAWPPPILETAEELIEDVIAPSEDEGSPEPTPWNVYSVLKFVGALILSVAVVSFVLGIMAAFIMSPYYSRGGRSREIFTTDFLTVFGHIISFTGMLMPLGLIYISVVRRHHHNFFSGMHLNKLTRQELFRYLLLGAGCVAAVMGFVGLLILTGLDKNIPKDMPILDEFRFGYARMIVFTIAALMAPTFEELVFRGYIFQGLKNSFGVTVSAIVVTALFVLMHAPQVGYGLIPLLLLCVVSIALIWVRIKTDSLTQCIVIHQIYNTILMLITWSMVLLFGIDKMAA